MLNLSNTPYEHLGVTFFKHPVQAFWISFSPYPVHYCVSKLRWPNLFISCGIWSGFCLFLFIYLVCTEVLKAKHVHTNNSWKVPFCHSTPLYTPTISLGVNLSKKRGNLIHQVTKTIFINSHSTTGSDAMTHFMNYVIVWKIM